MQISSIMRSGEYERQQIDQRSHFYLLGQPRHRTKEHTRHRHHVEWRLVVLGEMQAVEPASSAADEFQPLVEKLRERAVAMSM